MLQGLLRVMQQKEFALLSDELKILDAIRLPIHFSSTN